MRLKSLSAERVHGYLDFDIEFREDLTFLIGLNGSGKTTALRILMGLLTPSFESLSQIRFEAASVEIDSEGETTTISATMITDGIVLSISSVESPLEVSSAELQLLQNAQLQSDAHLPVVEKLQSHAVVRGIQDLSTPMFLGLNRRTQEDDDRWSPESEHRHRRRLMRSRPYRQGHPTFGGHMTTELHEVLLLVEETSNEIRFEKDQLDTKLRDDIVVGSFSYWSGTAEEAGHLPDKEKIQAIRQKQESIRAAAKELKLPRIQEAITDFYERMSKLIAAVDRAPKKATRGKPDPKFQEAVLKWLMNQAQVDRILGLIELLDEYLERQARLFLPLNRFVSLVNGFLKQTGKEIEVSERGMPHVRFNDVERPLFALSSGERQIVVMLAHLALNKRLAESGIFIVDEPELSLHISWQERFVRSVREANPNIQVILATHSPAIILDMGSHCVPISASVSDD